MEASFLARDFSAIFGLLPRKKTIGDVEPWKVQTPQWVGYTEEACAMNSAKEILKKTS